VRGPGWLAAVTAPGPEVVTDPKQRRDLGIEIILLLGVSLGASGLNALLDLIDRLTRPLALSKQTATINGVFIQNREWLDFLYQVVSLAEGFVPPALAVFLLYRYLRPPGAGFGIGLDTSRLKLESLQGAAFAALIGIPGLVLVYGAHRLGVSVMIVPSSLPDVWYRIPVLVVSALQNATSEEIIVMGYLLTRLAQLGWTRERAIGVAAVLRGSYHLYQGFGGFLGNAVMGVIFGWWFTRTRRVLPLLIAHFLLDAASFVGYVYLHNRVSWL
jgi:uncharacterized protein